MAVCFKVISQAAHDRKLKKNTFSLFLINAFYAVQTASDVLILQILKLSFSVIILYVFIISPYHQSIFIHILPLHRAYKCSGRTVECSEPLDGLLMVFAVLRRGKPPEGWIQFHIICS